MRIIIAPDSFKGSLSAVAAARAIERGLARVFPQAQTDLLPIADGGEGTVDALVFSLGGEIRTTTVLDPLGRDIAAAWGVVEGGRTAVIEMAAASGLPLLQTGELDPLRACTCGTGQLVRAALDAGVNRIILGIGGSATNDAGAGFLRALGVRFLDASGRDVPPGAEGLERLAGLDVSGLDPRLSGLRLDVASDVRNPLCGSNGASAVYGPQKGADAAMIRRLDAALERFAAVAAAATGRPEVPTMPGAGAAGGIGAALLFFTNAVMRSGVDMVLELSGFDALAAKARLVITGEGRTDFQTVFGKAPVGVARVAKRYGLPVLCLSGSLGPGATDVLEYGIDALMALPSRPMRLEECLEQADTLLEEAAEQAGRMVQAGMGLAR